MDVVIVDHALLLEREGCCLLPTSSGGWSECCSATPELLDVIATVNERTSLVMSLWHKQCYVTPSSSRELVGSSTRHRHVIYRYHIRDVVREWSVSYPDYCLPRPVIYSHEIKITMSVAIIVITFAKDHRAASHDIVVQWQNREYSSLRFTLDDTTRHGNSNRPASGALAEYKCTVAVKAQLVGLSVTGAAPVG